MKNKETTDMVDDKNTLEEGHEPVKKKSKTFSVKEFRKNLKSENIVGVLKTFQEVCSTQTKGHDYILEYLQAGGSCLELLQLMEMHSESCQPILEIVYLILLEINSKYSQYTSRAHDACKYFLSTYMTMTNKMLSMNSTRPERITILKFLTAIVTLSPNFAKDILIHININSTNLGFLTNVAYSKDAVRYAFINFLMAFLIDGYYPTISALLEKRGLLTSIIKGMMHDNADIICMAIDTLRNQILENPLVSKTVKMKTFNTAVVKDIVQIYNWKGPASLQKNTKKKKEDVVVVDVDPLLKVKVSDCVHQFLLILCTSHKYGVVFRDPQIGLGRKMQNNLIYTVLDSLDSPWKHSYASELVIKICGACPDLAKTVWTNLKPSLEPRRTEQWLSALRFMEKLVKELEPCRIEYCIKDLSPHQLAQITQMLIAPTQILKTLLEGETLNDKYLKYHTSQALAKCIESIELYLKSAETILTLENYSTYKNLIKTHIDRNYPNSTLLLANYKTKDELVNDFNYLDIIFQLLSMYQNVSPQLLDFTNPSINFKKILDYTKKISQDNPGILEIKIVKLYLEQDPVAFLPNTQLFEQILPFILDCYCRLHDDASYRVLEKIFLNTGVFQWCEVEIGIWITSLTNIEKCTDKIIQMFTKVLQQVFEKSTFYFTELSEMKANLPGRKESMDLKEVLENIAIENDVKIIKNYSLMRHVYVSPLILALLEYLRSVEKDKVLKSYLQYAFVNLLHIQTDPDLFFCIVEKYNCDFLNTNILSYFASWNDANSNKILSYKKGKIELLSKFSTVIASGDLNSFLNENDVPDVLNLLRMSSFYVANFARDKNLNQNLLENCISYIKFCVTKEVDVDILKHPLFLHYFSPLHIEKEHTSHALMTHFILSVIKETQQQNDILECYREKLFNALRKMFRKPLKYKNFKMNIFMNIITTLNLNFEQCFELCQLIIEFDEGNFVNSENNLSIFVPILKYLINSLNEIGKNCEKILGKEVIKRISKNISFLLSKNEYFDLGSCIKSFATYLETFPHCLDYISKELFTTIIQKDEYNKECVDLALLIFKNKCDQLSGDVLLNIDKIASKKGVILPILDVVQNFDIEEESLGIIFDKVESLIVKSMQKPQKAGQHFDKYHVGIEYFVNKFFTFERCKSYVDKIHKYETIEAFHVNTLKIIFQKAITEDQKYINNTTMTFIHLTMNFFKKKTRTDEDWIKFNSIIDTIKDFFDNLPENSNDTIGYYVQMLQNETFKMFCKFCLKFGVSGQENLLATLTVLVRKLPFTLEESQLLLEMLISHSEFLDWVLNDDSKCKTEILSLMYELFSGSKELMTKQYIPILLGAYRATLRKSDRIIFVTLKMFESEPSQSNFYDFNPFLWGKAAVNHYSLRSDVQKALWRQPRIGSVLDLLEDHIVLNTIKKYPVNVSLDSTSFELPSIDDVYNVYDLTFLIPLFTLLLAPENAVQTYRFTKNGALSLTITALGSQDEDTRNGACFVLSRFYHHVEARQSGKDNQLWLRFIEAICKGMAVMEDLKLNKFASVFLARMAMVLTQPTHVMYLPLSQYLSAKSTLDFSMIPELYTLLHSSDVNYKDHRNFILEVLRDGLVTSEDFHIALRSVSFKLIMEQFNSIVTDIDAKILIFQVIERATSLTEGSKYLCSNYGLLSWLYNVIINFNRSHRDMMLISQKILFNIINCKEDIDFFIVTLLTSHIVDNISNYNIAGDVVMIFLKNLCRIYQVSTEWLTEVRLNVLINAVDCKECQYFLKYGAKYLKFDLDNLDLSETNVDYYIKYLTLSWLRKKS